MPTWNEIDRTIEAELATGKSSPEVCDAIRHQHLGALSAYVNRPVIAYYSGFLQKRGPDGRVHPDSSINDLDMNGLMAVVHNLDRSNGLDIVLHTPGGGTEATRAIVSYPYKMFDKDIRVIVPQIAMSAGTMIVCAARQVVMGKHSALGPTDPQIRGHAAMGVLREIETAIEEIKKEPMKQVVWREIFGKFPPGFVANCERAVEGTRDMIREFLEGNMFSEHPDKGEKVNHVVNELMNFQGTTEHGHHFMIDKCIEMGLNVLELESDQDLQEHVLSVHHSFVATFARVKSIKIIENSQGATWAITP